MESFQLPIIEQTQRPRPYRRASRSYGMDSWRRFGSRRTRLVIESVLLSLAVIVSVVWFSAPYFARDYINRSFSGLPGYTGRVEWVRIHPWTASLDIYGVHLDKMEGGVLIHFFSAPRWNVSLQWSEIFRGKERASVTIYNPQINLVAGSTSVESQFYISMIWIDAVKQLIPWRVNQLQIHQGDLHYLDFNADPRIDLEMNDVEIIAANMSNSKGLKIPLPATVKVTARALVTGTLEMNMAVNFDEQFATFRQSLQMEHVPAVEVNSALQKYLKVRVKSGEIGLYSEVASDKGTYHGYIKGFFYRVEFAPRAADEGSPGAIWSGILNTAKGLFENDRQVIATQSQVSGRIDQPHVNATSAITGVLWNAYIEALRPGFDLNRRPSNSSAVITIPASASTENETAPRSPAAKR